MPREERIRLLEEIREEENDATEEDKHRAELKELTDRVHEAFSDIFKEKFTLLPQTKSTYRVKTEDGQVSLVVWDTLHVVITCSPVVVVITAFNCYDLM